MVSRRKSNFIDLENVEFPTGRDKTWNFKTQDSTEKRYGI